MEYKRLTMYVGEHVYYSKDGKPILPIEMLDTSYVREVLKKLAAYEDSGLSPEQVQEMAKVKAEGRLVELPCKVGDKVWILLERNDNDKTDVVESKVVRIMQTPNGMFLSCWIDAPLIENTLEFDISEIGKTVFLTKEAAEKAFGSDAP